MPVLKICVEASWKGPILDTVRPVAEFPLIDDVTSPGQKNIGQGRSMVLTDSSVLGVWCAVTRNKDIRFTLSQDESEIIALSSHGNFSLEMRLLDAKIYIFTLVDVP